jgi:hypothetical protein
LWSTKKAQAFSSQNSKEIICLWRNGQLNCVIRPIGQEDELIDRLNANITAMQSERDTLESAEEEHGLALCESAPLKPVKYAEL